MKMNLKDRKRGEMNEGDRVVRKKKSEKRRDKETERFMTLQARTQRRSLQPHPRCTYRRPVKGLCVRPRDGEGMAWDWMEVRRGTMERNETGRDMSVNNRANEMPLRESTLIHTVANNDNGCVMIMNATIRDLYISSAPFHYHSISSEVLMLYNSWHTVTYCMGTSIVLLHLYIKYK